MRSNLRGTLDRFYRWLESTYRARSRVRKVNKRLKAMGGGCREKDAIYRSEILPYWEKYGLKPAKRWHRLYGKAGQPYDVRYIPDDLWFGTIVPYFSNMEFRRPMEDKCLHHLQFPGVKRPETVLKCIAGVYYDDELNLKSRDQALARLMAADSELICKPSVDSGAGRLIEFVTPPLSRQAAEELLDRHGANFIVQKVIRQHPDLAQFNPSSVNTVRVISFLFDDEAHIISSALRIGPDGSRVDNSSKGGYMCRILPDGSLDKVAYDNDRHTYEQLGQGKPFAQVKIPSFDRIVRIAKEEQLKKPHFKLIGWDFTVTPEGEPVMIEYNVCPGGNQMTCGPAFGDLTDRVLEEVFLTRRLAKSQN